MKSILQFGFLLICGFSFSQSPQPFYNVTAASGNGLRLWNSDSYKIHMGNSSVYKYGPVTDFSIKMNMSNTNGRGWTWGKVGQVPVAALNTQGDFQINRDFFALGEVGIGTTSPRAYLDVGKTLSSGDLGTVMARLSEGNTTGDGTYLGVKGYSTSAANIKSFALEHSFHGVTNSSINFFRGGSTNDGFISLNAGNNSERMRIDNNGFVGIGTNSPRAYLDVGKALDSGEIGAVFARLFEGNTTGDGTYLGVKAYSTSAADIKSFALEHSFHGNTNSSINFHRGGATTGGFIAFSTGDNTEKLRIDEDGKVGIGTVDTGSHHLAVEGSIGAREIKVEGTGWSDFVFYKDYNLPTLKEVEQHILEKGHLQDIPSATEVEKNGINLGEMNAKLLQKIEELMLYTIQQQKEINELKKLVKK